MRDYDDDQSYELEPWDGNTTNPGAYVSDDYKNDDEYQDYDLDEAYEDSDLDEELDSEHNFHIAMNVFDLISTLVGLAIILVLAGLLFSLFTWVQRDVSQSLFFITAPFR